MRPYSTFIFGLKESELAKKIENLETEVSTLKSEIESLKSENEKLKTEVTSPQKSTKVAAIVSEDVAHSEVSLKYEFHFYIKLYEIWLNFNFILFKRVNIRLNLVLKKEKRNNLKLSMMVNFRLT